jgi:hypothetical protein
MFTRRTASADYSIGTAAGDGGIFADAAAS